MLQETRIRVDLLRRGGLRRVRRRRDNCCLQASRVIAWTQSAQDDAPRSLRSVEHCEHCDLVVHSNKSYHRHASRKCAELKHRVHGLDRGTTRTRRASPRNTTRSIIRRCTPDVAAVDVAAELLNAGPRRGRERIGHAVLALTLQRRLRRSCQSLKAIAQIFAQLCQRTSHVCEYDEGFTTLSARCYSCVKLTRAKRSASACDTLLMLFATVDDKASQTWLCATQDTIAEQVRERSRIRRADQADGPWRCIARNRQPAGAKNISHVLVNGRVEA